MTLDDVLNKLLFMAVSDDGRAIDIAMTGFEAAQLSFQIPTSFHISF